MSWAAILQQARAACNERDLRAIGAMLITTATRGAS